MPVLPSSITDPLWDQFQALLPKREAAVHPLGCHRPRIPNRVVFDKLLARLVLGGTYQQHADYICSATTMRARRDEWIAVGVFERLHQLALEAHDEAIGLGLENLVMDGCIVKARHEQPLRGDPPSAAQLFKQRPVFWPQEGCTRRTVGLLSTSPRQRQVKCGWLHNQHDSCFDGSGLRVPLLAGTEPSCVAHPISVTGRWPHWEGSLIQ